jgi:AcrR family transcriptional regulator
MVTEQTKKRPQEVDRSARSRIVAAAVKAFAVRGYYATTTRDIARIAGLSPAALYVHFNSKEDLLFEIMEGGHGSLLVAMTKAEAQAANETASERLLAIVKAFVHIYAVAFTPAHIADNEIAALRPAKRRRILALRAEIEDVVNRTIEVGVKSGEFEVASIRRASFFILSAAVGVAQWFDPKGELTAEEVASEYAALSLRSVAASSLAVR